MKAKPKPLTSSLIVLCTPEVLGARLALLIADYEAKSEPVTERAA